MKIKLIVNPASGDGRGKRSLYKIVKVFEKSKMDFSVDITRGFDAKELTLAAINNGYDTIVAAGGDGTISEVANGIIGTDVVFGAIPVGFGNDFVKALRIPYNINNACDIILNGKTSYIDVGFINGKYFVNSVGFGFDGEVLKEAIKTRGKLHSVIRYTIGVMKVFREFKGVKFSMILDAQDKIEIDALIVVISNGPYEASGLLFNPDAKVDDGLLNVCVMDEMSKMEALRHVPLVVYGKHTSSRYVKIFKARNINIKSENILFGHIDGEPVSSNEFNINVLNNKLKILVP